MANDFSNQRAVDLASFGKLAASILLDEAKFGLPPERVESISEDTVELDEALVAQVEALAAYRSATRLRDEAKAKANLAKHLSSVAAILYANDELDDADLVSAGLSPRRKGNNPRIKPKTVAAVTAAILPNGNVRLRRERGDNQRGVVFLVQARKNGEDWSMIDVTTRASVILPGYKPQFRIVAKSSSGQAVPSPTASIYDSARTSLRVAALKRVPRVERDDRARVTRDLKECRTRVTVAQTIDLYPWHPGSIHARTQFGKSPS